MLKTLDEIFDYVKDLTEEQQIKWLKETSYCYSRCRNKGMSVIESEKEAVDTANRLVGGVSKPIIRRKTKD